VTSMRALVVGLMIVAELSGAGVRAQASDAAGRAQATDAGGARISFRFDRPGVQVPRYTVTVLDSGATLYQGEESGAAATRTVSDAGDAAPGRPFKTQTRISQATTKRIFAMAKALKNFNVRCESTAKNVADTGKKTLSFVGPEGQGECTYNYSDNKSVAQLTDMFLGIVETMDEGRQLEHLHRFDRLGLDAAITTLAEQVNSGRALELGTIADTLRSIAGDTNLIQRVRVRASQLLSLLPPEMQHGP
jgi:hypothetical protein